MDVLYMTRGENGSFPGTHLTKSGQQAMAARRTEEAQRACGILGVRAVSFLNGRDGLLKSQPELAGTVLDRLVASDYRSVFCPWPYDNHSDHAATYGILHETLRQYPKDIDIWLYEVWLPLVHNICISIDKTIDVKVEAFLAHESQASTLNYAEAFRGLAQYRSLFCPPARYAEAFFHCDRLSLLNHENVPWPPITHSR